MWFATSPSGRTTCSAASWAPSLGDRRGVGHERANGVAISEEHHSQLVSTPTPVRLSLPDEPPITPLPIGTAKTDKHALRRASGPSAAGRGGARHPNALR